MAQVSRQLWPHDQQSIEMLQETFGLLLTGDTSHQKAFLLVGPKRSGKELLLAWQRSCLVKVMSAVQRSAVSGRILASHL